MSDALDRLVEIRSLIERMEESFGASGLSTEERELLRALAVMGIAKSDVAQPDRLHCQKALSKVTQSEYRGKLRSLALDADAQLSDAQKARI
ncbi:hypothetical protein [Donghicola eburneus]|uniref:Uncharacterized protein n=1 Tax=Donghicola eburneus TaxID=393278 RepID=A0A1M4MVA9_9RHOB|nr:hypothetical protein [Donghicola eburneus]SCM66223.1 hypothetical protein KARMA_0396 [Donghicola eburneus]